VVVAGEGRLLKRVIVRGTPRLTWNLIFTPSFPGTFMTCPAFFGNRLLVTPFLHIYHSSL
jgi:hypothetical protein